MTREELKEKIRDYIFRKYTEGQWSIADVEKIMLLIDEYTTPDLNEIWRDHFVSGIMQPSETINFLQMRNGWTIKGIKEELILFLDREYPKQDADEGAIRKHFFNYIRKRKPEKKREW